MRKLGDELRWIKFAFVIATTTRNALGKSLLFIFGNLLFTDCLLKISIAINLMRFCFEIAVSVACRLIALKIWSFTQEH